MSESDKARTNRRWVSSEEHRSNWDRIFRRDGTSAGSDRSDSRDDVEEEYTCTICKDTGIVLETRCPDCTEKESDTCTSS